MQRLEVSGAVRPIYGSLGVKRLSVECINIKLPQVMRCVVVRVKLVGRRLMEVRTEFCLCHYLHELKIAKVTLRHLA